MLGLLALRRVLKLKSPCPLFKSAMIFEGYSFSLVLELIHKWYELPVRSNANHRLSLAANSEWFHQLSSLTKVVQKASFSYVFSLQCTWRCCNDDLHDLSVLSLLSKPFRTTYREIQFREKTCTLYFYCTFKPISGAEEVFSECK